MSICTLANFSKILKMAGSSEKKASKNRIQQYRLFGSIALLLNLIYFHKIFVYFLLRKDISIQWIPSLVEFIGVLAIQVHYIVCIMARSRDIGGEKAESWGLDYFVLTAVTQMLRLYTKSSKVYLLLLVLPLHTLYSFKEVVSTMLPLLGSGPSAKGTEETQTESSNSIKNRNNGRKR
jgi:hypothetical protein